jgi:hypothetical protein
MACVSSGGAFDVVTAGGKWETLSGAGATEGGTKMAVLMTREVPGGTVRQYDRTNEIVGLAGMRDAPTGLVVQACAVTNDGIVIVEVWDSASSLDAWTGDRLERALAEAEMPQGALQTTLVHDLLYGAGSEPNVLVLLEAPGLTTDEYDAIVAKMPSHVGDGENHPAVMHVAAAAPDGFRIAALWDSEATYAEFATSELVPAVGDPRHFVLRIWPVHSCLRAKVSATA